MTADVVSTEVLARSSFSTFSRSLVVYRRRDGRSQEFWREAYDHGDGAAVLLHDPQRDRVLLVRQWRFGAHLNPPSNTDEPRGWLIEVPAGLIDGREPEAAARAEALEEVGVATHTLTRIAACYTSPGSTTERVTLYLGQYTPGDRIASGGGLEGEGEDIEIIEPTVDQALAMIASGRIIDAKTIILLYHLAWERSRESERV